MARSEAPVSMRNAMSMERWGSRIVLLLGGEFARFVLVRGLCAVLSYGAYLLLLLSSSYEFAYVSSYLFGIVLAYLVNSRFVFRVAMSRRSAIRFPLVYIVQFVGTFLILRFAVQWAHISPSIAYGLAVCVTIPITFVLSRRIIKAA